MACFVLTFDDATHFLCRVFDRARSWCSPERLRMARLQLTFDDTSQFLRRVWYPDQINKRGLLAPRAFKERDPRMSLTYRDESLRSEDAIEEYRRHFSDPNSDTLIAILWLTFRGLTREVHPPLVPRHEPDDNEPVYGHLHCSTPSPRDRPHMELLAKLVNDGQLAGVLCSFSSRTR